MIECFDIYVWIRKDEAQKKLFNPVSIFSIQTKEV